MISAIIIEDEKRVKDYIHKTLDKYFPDIKFHGAAISIEDGYTMIVENRPNIVFLDIQLSDGNGFELLKKFTNPSFHVIFITAHNEFAIEAIKFHPFDFLLKPFDLDELIESIQKVKNAIHLKPIKNFEEDTIPYLSENNRLSLVMANEIIYLEVKNITHIESNGSYSIFYTVLAEKHVVSKNLKEFEDLLPKNVFYRCHKSCLVNLRKVKRFFKEDGFFAEMDGGAKVEISRRKKDEFLTQMKSLF